MKHIHADLIKAWADGAEIEWWCPSTLLWKHIPDPHWFPDKKYRIKPHKWQHLIDAQNAGKKVQAKLNDGTWIDGHWEFDDPYGEYRLKPATVKFRNYMCNTGASICVYGVTHGANEEAARDKWNGFVQWVGDWQEVEIPEQL